MIKEQERVKVINYAKCLGLENRIDEVVAFRKQLVDAYTAAGLREAQENNDPADDLYLTDAAVSYVADPAFYGVDPLHTFVLHEQYRQVLCGYIVMAQQQVEALEDAICTAQGELLPTRPRLTPKEKAVVQQRIQAALSKKR
jgi:hypothetical protein